MSQSLSYSRGARGFIVMQFQQALARITRLSIKADGVFGPITESAVALLSHLESPSTSAGPNELAAVGLAWPDEFTRAMALVSALEGTGFGGMNAIDIDGAGVTLGIAGFTTASGEVQELIAKFLSADPAAVDCLTPADRKTIFQLLQPGSTRLQWESFFYGPSGSVRNQVRETVTQWGQHPGMVSCQLEMARHRFWERAVIDADRLGFVSTRARLFFLDVAIQNGGWRASHLAVASRMIKFHSEREMDRLEAAACAVAACAREKWKNDVLTRKQAIAKGEGIVHGVKISLSAQAIEPG